MAGKKGRSGVWKNPILVEKRKQQLLKVGIKTRFVKGHINSEEVKEKIKKSLTGRKREKILYGELSPNWKGDKAGYRAMHSWIQNRLGKINKCWMCGSEKTQRYEWSNISGLYKRSTRDWERLCVKCHRLKDDWINKVAIKSSIYKRRFV